MATSRHRANPTSRSVQGRIQRVSVRDFEQYALDTAAEGGFVYPAV
jgi:hypothetical protein